MASTGGGKEGSRWVRLGRGLRRHPQLIEGDGSLQGSPGANAAWPTKMVPDPKGKTKGPDARGPRSLPQLSPESPLRRGMK